MNQRSHILLILLAGLLFTSFSPVKRYIRKAESFVARGNLEAATRFYKKALEKEPENIRANYGYGMMLCELLDDYENALPHLEKANQPPIEDSLYDLLYALGKCYQHEGEFNTAISHFERLRYVVDLDEEIDFQKDIKKRIQDSRFALAHKDEKPTENIFVVNGGRSINTAYPEYVPVLLPGNKMIFTSKRKDHERERLNYLDGKYFESMYITDITPFGFRNTERYTLPDQHGENMKRWNKHESVISLSQDGKKLFVFRKGSIFEINLDETKTSDARKLETSMNKNNYENHAYLTRDEKRLFFSVEAESGLGGTDLYFSTKGEDGQWSVPRNLGEPVNTSFDEDAPFLSEDGQTLYFASTGHDGYGNFDLYRSAKLPDGGWGAPRNLGKPLNSPGHDIFLVLDSARANGYFASGRKGGFGDMDIYKIIYLDKIDTNCAGEFSEMITMTVRDTDSTDYINTVVLEMSEGYRVLSADWWLNGTHQSSDSLFFAHNYGASGTFTVGSKLIALCDTCLSPVVACNSIVNVFPELKATPEQTTEIVVMPGEADGELSEEQLRKIGFNSEPVLFGFDKSQLTPSYRRMLDSNITVLKKYDQLRIRVVGYTDSRGPAAYNRILSERRARAVKDYLIKNGIDNERVFEVQGKGESELVNDCDGSKPCRENLHKKNRRVKVIVVAEKLQK